MTYNYTNETIKQVRQLYISGKSSHEILAELKLPVTVRTIQRWINDAGISRTVGDAFRLAVSKGRVKWHLKQVKKHRVKMNPKLRYNIMTRDNFTCVKCGRKPPECILEVDHINSTPDDNRPENLQTLCYDCNKGKYLTE
jgi:hypothetical protein